jgi:hypothetical protein
MNLRTVAKRRSNFVLLESMQKKKSFLQNTTSRHGNKVWIWGEGLIPKLLHPLIRRYGLTTLEVEAISPRIISNLLYRTVLRSSCPRVNCSLANLLLNYGSLHCQAPPPCPIIYRIMTSFTEPSCSSAPLVRTHKAMGWGHLQHTAVFSSSPSACQDSEQGNMNLQLLAFTSEHNSYP